jgi:hypothetical protein
MAQTVGLDRVDHSFRIVTLVVGCFGPQAAVHRNSISVETVLVLLDNARGHYDFEGRGGGSEGRGRRRCVTTASEYMYVDRKTPVL